MRIALILLLFTFSCSSDLIDNFCGSNVEERESIYLYNNAADFNCGLDTYEVRDSQLIEALCQEILLLKPSGFFTATNLNYWYVEMKTNHSNWAKDYITLVKTQLNGYVFEVGTAKFRNDNLAKMIVDLLGIKDTKPCMTQLIQEKTWNNRAQLFHSPDNVLDSLIQQDTI